MAKLDGINIEIDEILGSLGGHVLVEVAKERARQDKKWGGADHDDDHHTVDFCRFIENYTGWAEMMAMMDSPEKARKRLIQIAALATAAVESIDRKKL